jgi:hypothetical protein
MRLAAVPDSKAVEIVRTYLRLVEERHLDEAGRYLAPEAEIMFPGGRRFDDLDAQVAAAAGRYRSIRKVFEGFDVIGGAESIVVYAFGELEGEDLAGQAFAGVRFIDRFEMREGLITNHRVWNDLAEAMHERSSE